MKVYNFFISCRTGKMLETKVMLVSLDLVGSTSVDGNVCDCYPAGSNLFLDLIANTRRDIEIRFKINFQFTVLC